MTLHSVAMDIAQAAVAAAGGAESAEDKIARYEAAFRVIAACPLSGFDFGDYVQSVIHDVLEGMEAECYKCGTSVHEGDCVDPDGDYGDPAFHFDASSGGRKAVSAELNLIGRLAYEAYCRKTGGVSLATGNKLPGWADLRDGMREAWGEGASAVATEMKRRALKEVSDAFYGFAETF